jgi:hypothetical protein
LQETRHGPGLLAIAVERGAWLFDEASEFDAAPHSVGVRLKNGREIEARSVARAIRRGVPCARKRPGEMSSAALAAMNSRRFIRSSSQLEVDGCKVSRLDGRRTHVAANAASQKQSWPQSSQGQKLTLAAEGAMPALSHVQAMRHAASIRSVQAR